MTKRYYDYDDAHNRGIAVILITAVAALLVLIALLVGLVWLATSVVVAHEAETGWMYDTACCSGKDCHHVAPQAVRATAEGWFVHLYPGDHPMATREVMFVIPFDSTKVRISGDQDFHVCIGSGGYSIYCIYVPNFGA